MMKIDIGNLHVIDYYLHQVKLTKSKSVFIPYYLSPKQLQQLGDLLISDFDISTEQREGWAYEPS